MASTSQFIGVIGESVFAPYRERVLYPIAAVGAGMFGPLAIYHFLHGDAVLGALLLCVVAMLAIDAVALNLGKRVPIPFPLLLLPGAVAVALSLTTHGIYGVLWSYPMCLFSYFVLSRPYANAVSVSLLGMTTTLVYLHMGGGITLRYFLSLALCIVVINVILGVLESLQQRLLRQSLVDPLTGAFNRRQMETSLAHALERHARTGQASSVVLVDVDNFKTINDRFGHEAGDTVLKAVVATIHQRCRKLDQLFRMGGEEFLLLLPDTGRDEATFVAEELRRTIAGSRMLEGRSVTVSMGVSQLRRDDGIDAWLRRVDLALYKAKDLGRDRVLATSTRLGPTTAVVPSLEEMPHA